MKPQVRDTHIFLPVKLLADFKRMAAANRRTMTAEIQLAMENWLREWKARPKIEESGVE